MAEAAGSYVLGKLTDAMQNLTQELPDVRGQIEHMQQEHRFIKALLRDADSKRNRNELVTEWLNQVRELSNRIARVIDTFRVEIEETYPESSNWVSKITMSVKSFYKMYKLGLRGELDDITRKLHWIYQRRTDFGVNDLGALNDVDDPEPSDHVNDPEVVSLEAEKRKIIKKLLDRNISRRTALSIVGTSGLEKTTLAPKLYKRMQHSRKPQGCLQGEDRKIINHIPPVPISRYDTDETDESDELEESDYSDYMDESDEQGERDELDEIGEYDEMHKMYESNEMQELYESDDSYESDLMNETDELQDDVDNLEEMFASDRWLNFESH